MYEKAIVIVDYTNVFKHHFRGQPILTLEDVVNRLIREIIQKYISVQFISIRLYDGWLDKNGLTNNASAVQTELSRFAGNLFPIRVDNTRRVRGYIKLVKEMHGVNGIWNNTYREKQGFPRLRVDRNVNRTECIKNAKHHQCPIDIIERFSQRNATCSVLNCNNDHSSFYIPGQKMVDTMMACDILAYGGEREPEDNTTTKVIYVLSDDVDLFPPIALCSKKNSNVSLHLKIKNQRQLSEYTNYFQNFNLNQNINIELL